MQTFLPDSGTYYRTTQAITGRGYTVPAGYRFNVSVPKKYTWFVDPHDPRYFEAAAVHDYVILELGWSRWKAAFVWDHYLRGKVPLWKRAILFITLATR